MIHRYNKDTQQKILREATDLFMSKGYLDAPTKGIAQEIRITRPNLCHYFGDREKLYTAVLENHLKDVGKALREIVQASETGFQITSTKMAQFLIETYLVGLFLMLHDLGSNLSKETRDHLFFLWRKNYREPFGETFSANQSVLRNGISKEITARHLFLVLTPYITRSGRPVERPLSVVRLIGLYLNGVLGEAQSCYMGGKIVR